MKQKLSPWFKGVDPVHIGPYERKSWCYSWWDGEQWMMAGSTPYIAEYLAKRGKVSTFQGKGVIWRGILK